MSAKYLMSAGSQGSLVVGDEEKNNSEGYDGMTTESTNIQDFQNL